MLSSGRCGQIVIQYTSHQINVTEYVGNPNPNTLKRNRPQQDRPRPAVTTSVNTHYGLTPMLTRHPSTSTKHAAVTKKYLLLESTWNVMAHGDAREGKWRGNWRMEWVASTLHTTSENGVSGITTADVQTSAASSRRNWPPSRRFKWNHPFRLKTKSGFWAYAITFKTQSNRSVLVVCILLGISPASEV